MKFTNYDLDCFLENVYDNTFYNNKGGMASPDMFTLYVALTSIKPKIVIESGVFKGLSTKLIRKTLGKDVTIICLDPYDKLNAGFRDTNVNTKYYIGNDFIDFGDLNIDHHNPDEVFAFFDCHQNAALRLEQSYKKGIKNLLFNDNYPVKCGSHYTLEHLRKNDGRYSIYNNEERAKINSLIDTYYIFPNIFKTIELSSQIAFFDSNEKEAIQKYKIFYDDVSKYRWNTYVKLK